MADALRLALPPGTRVVAGERHLQRPIAWARAFVTRPWAISNIERDALVLLSLRGLSGHTELQAIARLIEALVAANVAAIVLSEESPDIAEIAAHEEALPVLVLPPDAPLAEIERAVVGLIFDRDTQIQRRAAEIYQRLIQLALDDRPMQEIADILAETAARVVYLEDEYGILQAVAAPTDRELGGLPSVEEAPSLYSARAVLGISDKAPAATLSGCIRRILGDEGYAVCSAPISLAGTVAGFVTLLGRTEDMRDIDEEIVLRAAAALAVPIAKQRAIIETQTRLQGSFLENLFAGTMNDDEEIAARARYLGHDLREPYDTACLTLDDHIDGRAPLEEGQRAGLWTSCLDVARHEFMDRWPRALLRERGDILAVLVPAPKTGGPAEVRALMETLRVRLGLLVGGITTTIGIGRRAAGPREIVQSYAEAEQAARIGRQFLGGNRTVSFDELGVYRVIARVDDRETLEGFRKEYLGPVEEYDARHAADLVETLEGFFACNGNHARAAELLHLHRNTLLYRLDRIQALTGRDLAEPETRLSLQLALKIRRVFPTIAASQSRTTGGMPR